MLEVKSINENVVLLVGETQREIASAVIRFQEYYESPIPEIRNNIFTLGMLKSLYSKSSRCRANAFTYISTDTIQGDWNGFNFPSYALTPFIQGLFDPLTQEESDLLELFRYRTDKFYIIGVHKEQGETWALDHEIAHATYYINSAYKESVDKCLEGYDLADFKRMLIDWGYCDEVLDDECHAYLGCDYEWFVKEKKDEIQKYNLDMESLEPLSKSLKALFEEYNKGNDKI